METVKRGSLQTPAGVGWHPSQAFLGQEDLTHHRLGKASGQENSVNWLDLSEEQGDPGEAPGASVCRSRKEPLPAVRARIEKTLPAQLTHVNEQRRQERCCNDYKAERQCEQKGKGRKKSEPAGHMVRRADGLEKPGEGREPGQRTCIPVKGKTISAWGTAHSHTSASAGSPVLKRSLLSVVGLSLQDPWPCPSSSWLPHYLPQWHCSRCPPTFSSASLGRRWRNSPETLPTISLTFPLSQATLATLKATFNSKHLMIPSCVHECWEL